MKKSLIITILLFSFCFVQGMQQKSSIAQYVARAKAASRQEGLRTRSQVKTGKHGFLYAVGGGELTEEGERRFEWAYQLEQLQNKLLSEKTLYLGVPEDERAAAPTYGWRLLNSWLGNYNKLAKQYFLVKGFEDTKNAFENDHYEIYLMPDDVHLYDVCDTVVKSIKAFFLRDYNINAHDYVAFIAVRPTPGVTKSPHDGKDMPRIIIGLKTIGMTGLKTNADAIAFYKTMAENLIVYLSLLMGAIKNAGCIGTPRYSNRFEDSCIFWTYGSPDSGKGSGPRKFGISEERMLFMPRAAKKESSEAIVKQPPIETKKESATPKKRPQFEYKYRGKSQPQPTPEEKVITVPQPKLQSQQSSQPQ